MSDQVTTLKELFDASVEEHADRVALGVVGGEEITYAEYAKRVGDLQTVFQGLGVKPGDKVAIISENMPNWAITYFAITTMGAIAVPILQEFHPSAVHHILRHSESRLVVSSRRYIHKVEGDEDAFPKLKTIMVMNDFSIENEEGSVTPYSEALEHARARFEQFGEVARGRMEQFSEAAREKLSDLAREKVDRISDSARKQVDKFSDSARKFIDRRADKEFELTEESVAAILYTSGTTGHSKGVVLTHKNLVANCKNGIRAIPVLKTDRFISVLPMAHTYECSLGVIIPTHCGSSVYYLEKTPTPRTLLPAMQVIKPTILNVVPLIIEKIYKNRIKRKLNASNMTRGLMKIGLTRRKLSQVAGSKLIEAFGGELRCLCIGGRLWPRMSSPSLQMPNSPMPLAMA